MKLKINNAFLVVFVMSACSTVKKQSTPFNADVFMYGTVIRYDTTTFYDSSRKRLIPATIYYKPHVPFPKRLIILNPGYGGSRTDYSYIANNLAKNDYMVVTIQHDIKTDAPIPTTGNIYSARKPYWDEGIKNVLFVTSQLKIKYPQIDYKKIALIGHSNGGDIAMLMATEYPDFARIIISLDNRRVPIPKSKHLNIVSIRSMDQSADDGVLPTEQEQKEFHIKIVKVDIKHDSMGGLDETDEQKNKINNIILKYLEGHE